MTAADTETAFAKINLALHVRARRRDGYHDIETLFAFAEDGDRLSAAPADTLTLRIEGRFGEALAGGDLAENLVLRAAHALRAACGIAAGAALTLDKRLPVAAGIGGGSADAAAALRLLARMWGIAGDDPRLGAIAARLGADVPACLASTAQRGDGRGDVLAPVDPARLAGVPLLLVNPRVALSTADVFAAWDGQDRGPLAPGDPLAAALAGRNDLEPAARTVVPAIATIVARLRGPGVILVRMSGSGATCFALYANRAACDAATAAIAAERPGWWLLRTRLR